jgi:hypothetical protein
MKTRKNSLVVVMALNKLTKTPIKRVKAKPRTKLEVR